MEKLAEETVRSSSVHRIQRVRANRVMRSRLLPFTHTHQYARCRRCHRRSCHRPLNKRRQVHDQHIRFVSLEDDLFSLRVRDSYCKFNGLCGTEESRELMDTVVEGLFSVIITTVCG